MIFWKTFFRKVYYGGYRWISYIISRLTTIKDNRILCSSYDNTKYSCNPRYITEYLLNNAPGKYEIYWSFANKKIPSSLPAEIRVVKYLSLKYLYVLSTSKFLFSNTRMDIWRDFYKKRKGQQYVMTWHSSMSIKRVEKDVIDELSPEYVSKAQADSLNCDLILSGCKFRTKIIRNSFWYSGEILEYGTPRNDLLFTANFSLLKKEICNKYGIPIETKILLYAPTFRTDKSLDWYKFDWTDILSLLESKYNQIFYVLLRLHPNLSRLSFSYNKTHTIDVTSYHDIHELLCISDILVTDYSSSMFDFSVLKRACFIYASDYEQYDRGTYLNLAELPFPMAKNSSELLSIIDSFDMDSYRYMLASFDEKCVGSYEKGEACKAVYEWMKCK